MQLKQLNWLVQSMCLICGRAVRRKVIDNRGRLILMVQVWMVNLSLLPNLRSTAGFSVNGC